MSHPHAPSSPDPLDQRAFRDAMGRFVTGVAVATTIGADGVPLGVTINSFTSVSLDPPLVLFCLERRARSLPAFLDAGCFAVNLLAADQRSLSVRFARDAADWKGVAHSSWMTGAPVLDGVVAACDCVLETTFDGGDHLILVGRVHRIDAAPDREPLVYHRGRYARVDAPLF